MTEQRLKELEAKRSEEGLTDDEANELGQIYAEQEGREYANAESMPNPDENPEEGHDLPSTEAELEELRRTSDVHVGDEQFPKHEDAKPGDAPEPS
jgi:hypothetical protein